MIHATIELSPARRIIHEDQACLRRLEVELDALEPKPERVRPDPWNWEDDVALMRMADDGNPNCG